MNPTLPCGFFGLLRMASNAFAERAYVAAALAGLLISAAPAAGQGARSLSGPSYLDDVISLQLVAPAEVSQGETLSGLRVVVTNLTDEPQPLEYGGGLLDFVVEDAQGNMVWSNLQIVQTWLGGSTLGARESLTLGAPAERPNQVPRLGVPANWDLRDRSGLPLRPGTYRLKGVVRFVGRRPRGVPGLDEFRFETAPRDLVIREAPLPAYAQGLEVQLTAPRSAAVGERISMDLLLTNRSDRPLTLPRWGTMLGRQNDLDIIVFQNGREIWRAITAYNPSRGGTLTLMPGESRLMSSLVEGMAPEWDQRAQCGRFSFEPCPQPIEAGTYVVQGMARVASPTVSGEGTTVAAPPREMVIHP